MLAGRLASAVSRWGRVKERPRTCAGPDDQRLISTSTPGRRSLLISTSGSRTRQLLDSHFRARGRPFRLSHRVYGCSFRRTAGRHRFGRTPPPRWQRMKERRNLSTPPRQPERELHASQISMIFSDAHQREPRMAFRSSRHFLSAVARKPSRSTAQLSPSRRSAPQPVSPGSGTQAGSARECSANLAGLGMNGSRSSMGTWKRSGI